MQYIMFSCGARVCLYCQRTKLNITADIAGCCWGLTGGKYSNVMIFLNLSSVLDHIYEELAGIMDYHAPENLGSQILISVDV